MSLLSIFSRNTRHGVLWNVTEHIVQLARLNQLDEKPVLVDALAEFPPGDDEAISQWLRTVFPDRGSGYVAGYCGFHPTDRVLVRETINTKRLVEPNFLPGLLAEQAKLSSVRDWHIAALHPIDGEVFTTETPSRPGLLLGLPWQSVRDTQTRLRRIGIRPRRLEIGSVVMLGALARYVRETSYPHAVVACEIGLGHTRVYFVGKDGIHTPAPLPHGLVSIMEATMKELSAPGIGPAREALYSPSPELRAHSRRLVRMLSRHLKPAIDYLEMQTGQPIGALYCGHLPAPLAWLEEALCAAVDLEFLVPDLTSWLPRTGVQLSPDIPTPGRNWFQPLSLIGQLAPPANEA
jgi:hypothetical protein